jgi:predicted DsbA family dithiol-disulfide isomerase
MAEPLKIDFVSDISCPWCAIGLAALEQAVQEVGDEVSVQIHVQPFELNPAMAPGGQDITEHLTQKYGSTAQQQTQIRATIAQRGAEVGFVFNPTGRGRIYNTFDAHRLLHWAALESPDRQLAFKQALLLACHSQSQVMDSHAVLLEVVASVGLDVPRASAILASDEYAQEVRAAEAYYQAQGIHSVPAIIINERHLISGGQSAAVFAQALRQIAAQGQ